MGPKGSEKPYLKIFLGRDPELGTPLTPSESHGTKIFGSKIFSYDENTMLFYKIFRFMWFKFKFYAKNRSKTGNSLLKGDKQEK